MQTGANAAAREANAKIYWNAPTREDNVESQIALVDRIVENRECAGIALAPDDALALVTVVRRAIDAGIPMVVMSSPMDIPAGPKLSYVLNDDEEGGRLAALRIAELLHGRGSVAIVGINPSISGVMARARSFEAVLLRQYPNIRIVGKRIGLYNVPQEQQAAEEVLSENADLDAFVSLTSAATRGAYFALANTNKTGRVKLVGFDQDLYFASVHAGKIDSIIVQNSYEMGRQSVQLILDEPQNKSVTAEIRLKPTLVTRDNLNSPQVRSILSLNWSLPQ